MRVLVTGAGGLVGAAVGEAALAAGHAVRGVVGRRPAPAGAEALRADVRDDDAMAAAARGCDAVVHTAYVKDDPTVVVDGTRAVAQAARAAGARLVHVSTDLVFGERDAPYTEADAPAPALDYGRWKLDAERAVAAADPGAAIVRTSLVVGRPDGPQERLARTPGATFFTDEVRCPVDVDVLAGALLHVAALAHAGPLHVAGAPCTRLELADRLAPGVEHRGAPAPPGRPRRVVLDSTLARSLGVLA